MLTPCGVERTGSEPPLRLRLGQASKGMPGQGMMGVGFFVVSTLKAAFAIPFRVHAYPLVNLAGEPSEANHDQHLGMGRLANLDPGDLAPDLSQLSIVICPPALVGGFGFTWECRPGEEILMVGSEGPPD